MNDFESEYNLEYQLVAPTYNPNNPQVLILDYYPSIMQCQTTSEKKELELFFKAYFHTASMHHNHNSSYYELPEVQPQTSLDELPNDVYEQIELGKPQF